ncbi:DUF4215 domain-containing protein [Myxococcota bacterium]|nr:DUF4215 domain-containing protein [Myxococcota bacterium]MBU1380020.1 DUF4215 domain-containing protein [Myxococcota bacterium]MBU1497573.1 DUF4215 domain-containing protein [Myxococcota bacterium]
MYVIKKIIFSATVIPAFIFASCVETKNDDNNANNNTELCGNGTVDVGEQCDDGNTMNHDGCDSSCRWEPMCGNGRIDIGEECDDGNFANGDGCNISCEVETGCGNGILEVGEQCDDDNLNDGDGCSSNCIVEGTITCGNGILEYTEGCDDGNTVDGDGCSSTCMKENGCGDGNLVAPEQCDDGNAISGDGCSYDCLVEFICGNGQCNPEQGENCELCPQDCCDDCGNGILDDGEECDDGNNTSGDGCSRGCADEDGVQTCGNGIWEEGEECDDGNMTNHDGCSDDCVKEYVCGDGQCFTTEGESCEVCPQDCCPSCGNGSRQPGEVCDGLDLNEVTCEDLGYTGGTLACSTYCQYDTAACTGEGPVCGNGVVEVGEDCDGSAMNDSMCENTGYLSGLLLCNANCTFNYSGCRDQYRYMYEKFDKILPPTDWQFSYPFEWGKVSIAGPSACFSGDSCVGTVIKGWSPAVSAYGANYVVTPPIDLTDATNPVVYFWGWVDLSTSTYDEDWWRVEYSLDGTTWNALTNADPAYNGTRNAWTMAESSASWTPYLVNASAVIGNANVRFRFVSNLDHSSYTDEAGIYVDDVMIVESQYVPVAITNPSNLGVSVVGYPFNRQVDVWGGSGDFTYSITGAPTWLSIDSSTGELSGTPGAGNIGQVNITVVVNDNVNPLNSSTKAFTIEVMDAFYFNDLEGATIPSGWSISGTLWQFGTATSAGGPSACASGTKCFGTNLSGQYPNYMEMETNCVTSSPINLTSASSAVLVFNHWQAVENTYDGGTVQVSTNGTTWENTASVTPAYNDTCDGFPCWTTDFTSWSEVEIDITQWVGNNVHIRWCFFSEVSGTDLGWFVDDIMILGN